MRHVTHCPEETARLGAEFARRLRKGDTVCLSGEMGTGKTVFVQGCVKALGCDEPVTSPTFTLCNEYFTKEYKILHYDLYRIKDDDELFSVGFYDNDGDLVFAEWAERAVIKDRKCVTVAFGYGSGADERVIDIPEI